MTPTFEEPSVTVHLSRLTDEPSVEPAAEDLLDALRT